MIKSFLLLIFITLATNFFPGCSNPITESESLADIKATEETSEVDFSNSSILEFYVHKFIPNSPNSAVRDAYVEIYSGGTLIYSVGTTAANGKISMPSILLPQGEYMVVAYTMNGKYMGLYGYANFTNSRSSSFVSIWVYHM